VHALRKFVPTKNPDTQEGRFEEEGQQRFNCQRRSENIAHVARVVGPVHAKLKFHHNTGDHAHGKINQEQLAPEFGHGFIHLLAGTHVLRLHHCHQHRKSQGQRHKEEMVHTRDCKLPLRQRLHVHIEDPPEFGISVPG